MLLVWNNGLGGPDLLPKGLPGPVTNLLQPPGAQPQGQLLPGAACLPDGASRVYGGQKRAPDPLELELEGAAVSFFVGAGI